MQIEKKLNTQSGYENTKMKSNGDKIGSAETNIHRSWTVQLGRHTLADEGDVARRDNVPQNTSETEKQNK